MILPTFLYIILQIDMLTYLFMYLLQYLQLQLNVFPIFLRKEVVNLANVS